MSEVVQSFILFFVGIGFLLFVMSYITNDSRRLDMEARNDRREFGEPIKKSAKENRNAKHRQNE